MRTLLLLFSCLALSASSFAANDTASRKLDIEWQKLGQSIVALDQELDGVMGVAIYDLTSGREWLYHADETFPTASTIKLAVLAELYREDEQAAQGHPGNAKLSDLYTVRKEDLVADSSVLGNLTPGVTVLTNRDLAGIMVAVSDNSATNILIDRLTMDRVNAMLVKIGAPETKLRRKMMDLDAAKQGRENVATPHQIVKLLTEAYRGNLFDAERTKDFFNVLSTTKESPIPKMLPEGLRIANKPGELAGVRCDAGIIFVPNRPFAIAVMTAYDRDERAAANLISRIALQAYRLFDTLSVSSEYGRQITERNSR